MFSDYIILIIVFIFILIILCKAYLIHNMYLFKDGPNDCDKIFDNLYTGLKVKRKQSAQQNKLY